MKRPDPLPTWMNITVPLEYEVWLSLFATFFVFTVLLKLFKWSKLTGKWDPIILVVLFLREGSFEMKKCSEGLRIFFFVFTWSAFVITSGYMGALKACMAVPFRPAPIGEVITFDG